MASKLRYVVLAACCVVNFIVIGFVLSLGVIYVELINVFGATRAQMALMQSLCLGLTYGGAIFASSFVKKFGNSVSCIVAGFLSGASVMAASFLTSVPSLIIFVGAITGFCLSVCHLVSYLTVSEVLFDRKGFGEAVIMAGGGVGACCMSIVNRVLLDMYGWRGTFLLLSGMLFNICLFAMINQTFKRLYLQSENLAEHGDVQSHNQRQERTESYQRQDDDQIQTHSHSDKNELQDDTSHPCKNVKIHYDDDKQGDRNGEVELECDGIQIQHDIDSDYQNVKQLKSLTEGQKCHQEEHDYSKVDGVREQRCGGVQIQREKFNKDGKLTEEQPSTDVETQHESDHKQQELIGKVHLKQSDEILSQRHSDHNIKNEEKLAKETKPQKGGNENIPFLNDDDIQTSDCRNRYLGSDQSQCQNREPFRNRLANESSSEVLGFQYENSDAQTSPPRKRNGCRDMTSSLYTYFDLQVLKYKIFRILLLAQILMWLCVVTVLFLIVDIVGEKGHDLTAGSYFLSALSVASIFGNLFGGLLTSVCHVRGLSLIAVSACCLGCVTLAISFVNSFAPLMSLVVLFGFLFGLVALCTPVIVQELIPLDIYATSLGLVFGCGGFVDIVGGPLGGLIRDVSGSYTLMLYGESVILFCTGIISFYLRWFSSKHPYRENGTESQL